MKMRLLLPESNQSSIYATGTCKECLFKVPLDETTRLQDTEECTVKLFNEKVKLSACKNMQIWECPECFYPNNLGDFWYLERRTNQPKLNAEHEERYS
jgi:hypothetical protein